MLTSFPGKGKVTLVGSDDGVTFYTLHGLTRHSTKNITTNAKVDEVVLDFSPKGGPKDLAGAFSEHSIRWPNGNVWSKVQCCLRTLPPAKLTASAASTSIQSTTRMAPL